MQSFPVVCAWRASCSARVSRGPSPMCRAPTARWSSACRCAPAIPPRASWRRCARRGAAIRPTSMAAVALAMAYIDQAGAEGDPRYVSYAQSTLQRWWNLPEPPAAVRTVRAIVLQYDHRFDEALADLAAAVRADPDDALAWSWSTAIHLVRGNLDGARQMPARPRWRRLGARSGGRRLPRADRCADRPRGARRHVVARGAAVAQRRRSRAAPLGADAPGRNRRTRRPRRSGRSRVPRRARAAAARRVPAGGLRRLPARPRPRGRGAHAAQGPVACRRAAAAPGHRRQD